MRPSFNNTCPHNMVFYTAGCSPTALVKWNEPVADDNSGHISVSYPAIRPPTQLDVGLYRVIYSAKDDNGNSANCSFTVQVTSMTLRMITPYNYYSYILIKWVGLRAPSNWPPKLQIYFAIHLRETHVGIAPENIVIVAGLKITAINHLHFLGYLLINRWKFASRPMKTNVFHSQENHVQSFLNQYMDIYR